MPRSSSSDHGTDAERVQPHGIDVQPELGHTAGDRSAAPGDPGGADRSLLGVLDPTDRGRTRALQPLRPLRGGGAESWRFTAECLQSTADERLINASCFLDDAVNGDQELQGVDPRLSWAATPGADAARDDLEASIRTGLVRRAERQWPCVLLVGRQHEAGRDARLLRGRGAVPAGHHAAAAATRCAAVRRQCDPGPGGRRLLRGPRAPT